MVVWVSGAERDADEPKRTLYVFDDLSVAHGMRESRSHHDQTKQARLRKAVTVPPRLRIYQIGLVGMVTLRKAAGRRGMEG